MNTIRPMVADFYHGEDIPSFEKLKQQGIVGIFHKASDGCTIVDDKYALRKPLALAAGLEWGAYHFLENSDIPTQVDHFIKSAGEDVRLALDWERPLHGEPATPKMALEFLNLVKNKTGQTPWVYGGEMLKMQKLPNEFAEFPLWLSEYSSIARVPKPWTNYTLWQYTEEGKIASDLSTFKGTPDELKKVWLDTVKGTLDDEKRLSTSGTSCPQS